MTARIGLTQGFHALIDESDYDTVASVGSWFLAVCDGRRYARRHRPAREGGPHSLHSFLTGWPLVDHINGDGLDNRRANLRPATPSQNSANRGPASNNTSGYKGVSLYRRTGRWRASVGIDGAQHHLGYFTEPIDAARAYDAAALHHFGEFARLNFLLTDGDSP